MPIKTTVEYLILPPEEKVGILAHTDDVRLVYTDPLGPPSVFINGTEVKNYTLFNYVQEGRYGMNFTIEFFANVRTIHEPPETV